MTRDILFALLLLAFGACTWIYVNVGDLRAELSEYR